VNVYGADSKSKLKTCHDSLVSVCLVVLPEFDHKIIWGIRGVYAQNRAYHEGFSTKLWPDSKHNNEDPEGLSSAVDIAPWYSDKPHIRWDQELEFAYLAGHMMQAAADLGIKLRWGGDWNSNDDLHDRNIPFDLGHFELA